jgi:hypothetical protein
LKKNFREIYAKKNSADKETSGKTAGFNPVAGTKLYKK